ncbi:hypothetical protein RDABS01_038427 [Bienertia sinuspersici]
MAESKKLSINEVEEEDRLSSLPDAILIDILSRIPIDSAATTSVLSHRWRYLWTSLTHFNLSTDSSSNFTSIIDLILGQLTSPKLAEFRLHLSSPLDFPEHDILESCFRHVLDRSVEKVFIDVRCCFFEEDFWVPVCLFNSQFLVVLELGGKIKVDLDMCGIRDLIQLPKLKKLKMDFLLDVPLWLGPLIRSCPLLEDLDLVFKLDVVDSEIADCVDIFGLNLKTLNIDLESSSKTQRTKMSIDAPKLVNLEIRDCNSHYYFVHDPSALVNAYIDLRMDYDFEEEFEDEEFEDDDYLHLMSKFVRGIYCANILELKLQSRSNIFTYLACVDGRFEITFDDIGLDGWKDLLLSLQYFPNLKHLKVKMLRDPLMEHNNWCPPNYVPDCLASKLRTIQIWGLNETDDDLKLLGYILSNASHLEELWVRVFIKEKCEKAYVLWKECQFCKSLFELPRISSTCEVVFSGSSVTASSNTFKNGNLIFQMSWDD